MWVELTDNWAKGWVIGKDGFQHLAERRDGKIVDKKYGYEIDVHKVWTLA
jgi:hypothetical protein